MAYPRQKGQRERPASSRITKGEKKTGPWVSWIAIFLGVGMSIIGLLLLLWGFAWQTGVGEPGEINDDPLVGGPALIPLGAVMAAVGVMWLFTGWNGFKGQDHRQDLKPCPFCGRRIESDLNFCYFCNRSFDEGGKKEDIKREKKARPISEEQL
ncbi:MAG: hypothetical protein R6V01_06350 [Thermoplasmatota archaeon]